MRIQKRWAALALVLVSCGKGDTIVNEGDSITGAAGASGRSLGSGECVSDVECSDGLFCNGAELCAPDEEDADDFGCVEARRAPECDDGVSCTTDECSNVLGQCEFSPVDSDGDGHADAACEDADGNTLGDDCDDDDVNRYPGNTEVCDPDDHDEDCDPNTFGERDRDGDGEADAACCNDDGDEKVCGTDCDDLDLTRRKFQPEFCDGVDNDCNGEIDDNPGPVAWYRDADGDLFGIFEEDPLESCSPVPGYSVLATDCLDDERAQHPAQIELCDFIDNDCDGLIDEPAYCDQGGGVEDPGPGTGGAGMSGGSGGAGTGGMGTGGVGTGGVGTGGVGTGGAGTGGEFNTPNCSGPLFRTHLLRKDGYLLHIPPTGDWHTIVGALDAQPINDFVAAGEGETHACGLRAGGEVVCWGLTTNADQYGQLGDGTVGDPTTFYRASPVLKPGDVPFVDADSVAQSTPSAYTSCAVDQNQKLWCWGRLNYLLNNGSTLDSAYAQAMPETSVSELDEVLAVSVGPEYGCVLRNGLTQNEVWCWGRNLSGELGTGDQTNRQYPQKVLGLTNPSTIAAGQGHVCAIVGGGQVRCWGNNGSGQCGNNSTSTPVFAPVTVQLESGEPLSNIVEVSAGNGSTCAIDTSETLWCWGSTNEIYASVHQVLAAEVRDAVSIGQANESAAASRLFLRNDGSYQWNNTNFMPNCGELEAPPE